jgi:multidrug resistance protein
MSGKKPGVLGEVVVASLVKDTQMTPGKISNIILLLSASVALMMTGYGIIMPVFARRLGEFGDGVKELGAMTMAFALAQMIGAPLWGGVADRRGRRPIILLALTAVTLSYIGYIFAPNVVVFISVRAVAGFLTAGLFPAGMGVVADIVPEEQRARWVGIIMGSYAVGMIFGPVIGGFLYDALGYAAPFILSSVVAFLALLAALFRIPETRNREQRWREALRSRRDRPLAPKKQSLWAILPRPLTIIGTLLFIDFIGSFGFAFVEPQMVFYFYDELLWTTVQFGVVVGVYGMVMVAGQMVLGQLSDRWGRKPIILAGLVPNLFFYIGLATLTDYDTMIMVAAVAGLGNALIAPAISAYYLDITAKEHRSRVVGVKESFLALGGVLGPLAVAAIAPLTTPQGIFWIASALGLFGLLLGVVLLQEPKHSAADSLGIQEEISRQRALAAQASLGGIVMRAYATRSTTSK